MDRTKYFVALLVIVALGMASLGLAGCNEKSGDDGAGLLTVTDLVPGAEERQYQQSGALATAVGFLILLVLSTLV